ncbi:MAG: cytidine deaminase [Chthoniobacterales bacterium]|nr:cytidine deaminase [Chthoniobacterales bacterium]
MGAQISLETLTALAWKARENSYSPYSKFAVGTALVTETGETFVGCNIENASFSLTICAERVAVAAAVAAGFQRFSAIALAAETKDAVVPCGAWQFLAEFNPSLQIHCAGRGGISKTVPLSELLPSPFLKF